MMVTSAALHALAKAGQWRLCEEIYSFAAAGAGAAGGAEAVISDDACNAMLQAYAVAGEHARAVRFFKVVLQGLNRIDGLGPPDSRSPEVVDDAGKGTKTEQKQRRTSTPAGKRWNPQAYTILMQACERGGDFATSRMLFDKMVEEIGAKRQREQEQIFFKNIPNDNRAALTVDSLLLYTTALSACARAAGETARKDHFEPAATALSLLDEMRAKKVSYFSATKRGKTAKSGLACCFFLGIHACENAKRFRQSEELAQELLDLKLVDLRPARGRGRNSKPETDRSARLDAVVWRLLKQELGIGEGVRRVPGNEGRILVPANALEARRKRALATTWGTKIW
eukprot:g2277.t1